MENFNLKNGKLVYYKDELVGGEFKYGTHKVAFVPCKGNKDFTEMVIAENEMQLLSRLYMSQEFPKEKEVA